MSLTTYNTRSQMVQFLTNYHLPYNLEITTNTTKLVSQAQEYPGKWILTDSPIKFKDLGFIRQVKTSVKDRLPIELYGTEDVKYYHLRAKQAGEYKNAYEVDINGAYWEIAYKLGYLPKKIYEKGLRVSKNARLIALGALATQKGYYSYDGQRVTEKTVVPTMEERRRASIFFHVAKELGDYMFEFIQNFGGVLFFWVDAFFVENIEVADEVRQFFADRGLWVKIIETPRLTIEEYPEKWQIEAVEVKRCEHTGGLKSINPKFFQFGKPGKKNEQIRKFLAAF